MRRKLQTKRGRQRYALRMETVEPVFGQIKKGRGFRQFLLRSLAKVRAEWSLICTGTTCSNCSAWVVKPTVLAGQRVLFPIGLAPANPGSANSISYRHAGSHYRKFLILRRAASTTTTGLGWWLRPDFATGGAASLMGAARPLVAPLRTLQP